MTVTRRLSTSTMLVAALGSLTLALGCGFETTQDSSSTAPESDHAAIDPQEIEPEQMEEPIRLLRSGTGTWDYAPGRDGEIWGDSGTLLRFNVAVEEGLGIETADFDAMVKETLDDERSWIAGDWRFEQVGENGDADFTLYLASPKKRQELCGSANLTVSCRNGDNVVINSARWIEGVEHWDSTLEEYRYYVINHEVGHRLGHGHVVCPAEGEPSPVMAQQTFQLAGCTGNGWPYLDGEFIDGPVGEYGGPALPEDDYDD
ncbi:DUF3152 domain-containing protein [Natronoglycomyces albus]|uniref:DUF3152 domain-containing protein n=1 Tax=Natronoglycomyces albus TaxID=2811108 RepID=A0A895XWF1_9ACTN|nr:DUF3152 domain-containing protein [Natronoglycomyces albus]QSB05958.1 DUF3152 domain-containing protein [Natronoglycomyces albus]